VLGASPRGFESPILRHKHKHKRVGCKHSANSRGSNPPFSATNTNTSVLGASTAPTAGVRIPHSPPQTKVCPYTVMMVAFIILLLVIWAVLAILGFVIKGLFWLAIIGILLFIITGIVGFIRRNLRGDRS
jgi:hypothetical protein